MLQQQKIYAENINSFLQKLQVVIKDGWTLVDKQDFSMAMSTNYWMCVLEKDVLPERIYTKQELNDMEYEELKKVAKLYDCFNRARDVMVGKVLEKQEQRKEQ